MAVMPADHVISPDAAFARAITLAAKLVEESPQRIVTFGIRPTYAAESFGYIERGEQLKIAGGGAAASDAAVYRVKQFREKPKADVAREYLAAGTFYWNSGIFVWKAATILQALEERQPEMVEHLKTHRRRPRQRGPRRSVCPRVRGDQGHFDRLRRDGAGPGRAGDRSAVCLGRRGQLAGDRAAAKGPMPRATRSRPSTWACARAARSSAGRDDHLIVTLGVSDCIVVHTPDATLVANKHDEESIRELVKLIAERGWQQYL